MNAYDRSFCAHLPLECKLNAVTPTRQYKHAGSGPILKGWVVADRRMTIMMMMSHTEVAWTASMRKDIPRLINEVGDIRLEGLI